jgi:acetylornithine deacetylase
MAHAATTVERAVVSALSSLEGGLADLARALIAVPSVGGTQAERHAQHLVADWLNAFGVPVQRREVAVDPLAPGFPGMEVERSSVEVVTGRLPGRSPDAPALVLLGHTDVVPPAGPQQFRPTLADGVLSGRGAVDMKSGVAAMCVAAAALARAGAVPAGDVVIAPVSAEEDGGAGTFLLLSHGLLGPLPPGSSAVIPEPTGNRVVVGNGGALTFRITLEGRAAHGALRSSGVDAIGLVPVVLQALADLEARRCADAGPLFADWDLAYPISVGTVHGGDWASTVASRVELTGRYGVRLHETTAQAQAVFEAAVAAAADSHPWLAEHPPAVQWWGAQFASACTDPGAPVVSALIDAGACGPVAAAPYGSDLRLLVAMGGLPTVQYGPGDPRAAHTAQESVAFADVVRCARTLALTALRGTARAAVPVDNVGR